MAPLINSLSSLYRANLIGGAALPNWDSTQLEFAPASNKVWLPIASYQSDDVTTVIASTESFPKDIFWSPDGLKLFVTGNTNGGKIYEYTTSIPWNADGLSLNYTLNVNTFITNPYGLYISPDGNYLFVMSTNNDRVYRYNLSTPWDLQSASISLNVLVSGSELTPTGLYFKPDGTRLYLTGSSNKYIVEYPITGSAWSLTLGTYQRFLINTLGTPSAIAVSNDGTKVYTTETTNDTIRSFTLSTPWSVNTASYDNSSLNASDTFPTGLYLKPDGSRIFSIGTGSDYLREFSAGGYYYGTNTKRGLYINSDGDKLFTLQTSGGDRIEKYTLSTGWDVGSITGPTQTLSTSNSLHRDLHFSSDGTKMYLIYAATARKIEHYNLGTGWDLSTATLANTTDYTSNTSLSEMNGISLSSDGSKLYFVDQTSSAIYQQDLSTSWDLSTASSNTSFDISTIPGIASSGYGMWIDSTGTHLYLPSNERVFRLKFGTSWDLSTLSFVSDSRTYHNLNGIVSSGMAWNDDGSEAIVISFGNPRQIFKFTVPSI